MDQPAPPSYEDATKGGEPPMAHQPSAPPPPGLYQHGPPPPGVQPYPPTAAPQGQQPPFGQPAYPPSSAPGAGYGQPAPQGPGGGAYPQYTYNTVQAGVVPGGGYQYTPTQGGVNPVTAGYQTTPLAYTSAPMNSDQRRKKMLLGGCIFIVTIVVMVIVFTTIIG